jgi:hypothetical protein
VRISFPKKARWLERSRIEPTTISLSVTPTSPLANGIKTKGRNTREMIKIELMNFICLMVLSFLWGIDWNSM